MWRSVALVLASRLVGGELNLSFNDRSGLSCACRCLQGDAAAEEFETKDVAKPQSISRPKSISNFDDVFSWTKTLLSPAEVHADEEQDNQAQPQDFETERKQNADQNTPDKTTSSDDSDDTARGPVRVSVFYDAGCPFSKNFLTTSFWNVVRHLPDSLSAWKTARDRAFWRPYAVDNLLLEVVPYSNARYDDDGNIVCQHGPHECELNRLHACLNTQVGGKRALNATVCTVYHNLEPVKDARRKCMTDDDNRLVDECMAHDDVTKEIMERVMRSNHQYVPWVEINGELSERSRKEMMKEICTRRKPSQDKPSICTDSMGGAAFALRETETQFVGRDETMRQPVTPRAVSLRDGDG